MSTNTPKRCCSDLKLDRLLVGDLDDVEAHALHAHLDQSLACRARYDELAADRDDFVAATPRLSFTRQAVVTSSSASSSSSSRQRWRFVAAGVSTMAAAAGVLLLVLPGPSGDDVDIVRSKGAPVALTVHRKRGDSVSALRRTDTVVAGDVLRVEVTSPAAAAVVIVSADTDGVAAWSQRAVDVEAGTTTLPFAVELGAAGGDLVVSAYVCAHGVVVADVEAAGGAAMAGCEIAVAHLKREHL